MESVNVISSPETAIVALDPVRSSLLASLRQEPASATSLARRHGLPRQRVNYHLRELESHGLIELAEERQRRGLVERVMRPSATSYLVSPAALGGAAATPETVPPAERMSARYLVALAGRTIREVGELLGRASAAGRSLPTLSVDVDLRFRSAADRAAFADELADAVMALAAKYHDETAASGRWHRLVVLAHPRPKGD